MKSPDKFLMGIIIGVVVLLAVVFGVILTRPAEEYQAEDTPEGLAHNYLLALQYEDYQRAYSYLSPSLSGYPKSPIEFKRAVERDRWRFRTDSSISMTVESSELLGEDQAVVEVRETRFFSGDLFSSSQSTIDFEIYLVLEDDQWKIKDADYYFAACWTRPEGCN
jgi:hypothetical protein